MKTIVNLENKELNFDYEGSTYYFPTGVFIQVEDNLYNHLKELVPLAFNFEPELKKTDVGIKVKKAPTNTKFTGARFGIKSNSFSDDLPTSGKTDNDGVQWYGDGLTDDQI